MENGCWVDIFPPMPTPRCLVACVTAKSRLVVAGGDQDRCAGGLETGTQKQRSGAPHPLFQENVPLYPQQS